MHVAHEARTRAALCVAADPQVSGRRGHRNLQLSLSRFIINKRGYTEDHSGVSSDRQTVDHLLIRGYTEPHSGASYGGGCPWSFFHK